MNHAGSRTTRRLITILLAAVAAAGCRTGTNYLPEEVPRYEGSPSAVPPVSTGVDTLDVIAFNIKFAERIDRAIELLRSVPELTRADVMLLNEMDAEGTQRIADAFRMHYVYFPAVARRRTGRDFGNAVLSRWPIEDAERIVLPHAARLQKTERTATAATIRVGEAPVRVYATHLGTFFEIGPGARREQLRAILEDSRHYRHAIIGGDMNDGYIGSMVGGEYGFTWPTQDGPRTMRFGRVDHIFLKNLSLPDSAAAGTIRDSRGSSDHSPVWVRGVLTQH